MKISIYSLNKLIQLFVVQQLKDIRNKCSMMRTKKDLVKLKHNETMKQLKDCGTMRRVCQQLMPNTSKDIDAQRLRENLNIVAGLRSGNRKQVTRSLILQKIFSSNPKVILINDIGAIFLSRY